jgi:diguanylate cyclase (GGDEF)-like protein/PAS domain S-box-containing protein
MNANSAIDYFVVLQSVSFPVILTSLGDGENNIIYSNRAFESLTGYSAEESRGRNCRFLQGPETNRSTVAEIRAAIENGLPIRRELLNYRKNGEAFWNELDIVPRMDAAGALIGFIGIQNDVTARHSAMEARAEAEAQLKSVVDNVPGYLYRRLMKSDGTLELPYMSASFRRLLRLPEGESSELIDARRYIHPQDVPLLDAGVVQSAATMSPLKTEFRIVAPSGSVQWIRSYSTPRRSRDDIIWDAIAIDVSAEKAAEEGLAFLTYNDPLTGLPSRRSFEQSLNSAIENGDGRQVLGLWVVDISGLNEINDFVGRDAGDQVLRHAAARLSTLCSEGGGAIVARTGGDEFSIVHVTDDFRFDPEGFGKAVSVAFSRPVEEVDKPLIIRSSIGFASFRENGDPREQSAANIAAELMRRANVALFAARKAGPDTFCLYQEAFDDEVRDRAQRRQSIQHAITERQFELHYHPVVDLASGAIVGAEALIRWRHPELGMQRPDLFIPLAEETGLIVPIGEWVVREAMRQMREWKREGLKPPRIAINVSSVQIKKSDFLATLVRALRDFDAEPGDFELELTEGQIFDQSKATVDVLSGIKSAGFGLAVDDFGTGYASLRYVRDLPVSKVKIDQTFVRHMVVGSSDAAIIRAIIAMAKSLNLDVVAEGIETAMQRDFLRSEGCRIGQGYFFSLPLMPEDFGWLLRDGVHLPRKRTVSPSDESSRP